MPRFSRRLIYGAAAFAAPFFMAATGPAQDFQPRIPVIEELPEGPGREETFYACTACHGLDLIKAQRMDTAGWERTLDYMINVQGMFPPTPEERAVIVGYLSTVFPAAPPSGPAYVNPFLP
jgi:hypothetical protein